MIFCSEQTLCFRDCGVECEPAFAIGMNYPISSDTGAHKPAEYSTDALLGWGEIGDDLVLSPMVSIICSIGM